MVLLKCRFSLLFSFTVSITLLYVSHWPQSRVCYYKVFQLSIQYPHWGSILEFPHPSQQYKIDSLTTLLWNYPMAVTFKLSLGKIQGFGLGSRFLVWSLPTVNYPQVKTCRLLTSSLIALERVLHLLHQCNRQFLPMLSFIQQTEDLLVFLTTFL